MFEITENFTGTEDNSKMKFGDTGGSMNSLNTNILNCPTVLNGMSHEMRTHMNAIVAFSFLMKENGCTNNDREEFSNQILSSCEQLIGLFDSFLDSAIIDTGNSKADSKICNFDTILNDLFSEFRATIRKEGISDIELIQEIQFSNSLEVIIDINKIFRAISSLFQNSIRNTKSGYIKIGYFYKEEKITFYILDSGQGYFKCKEFLNTKDLSESLKSFSDTYTAINVILAKKLIQMLNGNIWIECNGLTGTGIYFSIPVKIVEISDGNINSYINNLIAI
jgi:signal transduction histidine kinase